MGDVVDTDLQTEIRGLYVGDASVIPMEWGLPPTFTVMALGRRLGRRFTGVVAEAPSGAGWAMGEPVRIERDEIGPAVAVVVLENPPLNLFDEEVFAGWAHAVGELVALTDPGHADRARAVLVEARGKVVSGGVDVSLFQAIADDQEAVAAGGHPVGPPAARRADPGGPAGADGLRRARPHASPRRSRSPWPATSCWPPSARSSGWWRSSSGSRRRWAARSGSPSGAGPARARELVFTGERYHGRGAGAVERREPGAARRRASPRPPGRTRARWRRGRPSRTRRPSGWSPPPYATAVRAADDAVPAVSGALFATTDLPGGGGVLPEGRARARRSTVDD